MLRILHLEDHADDAFLIEQTLTVNGVKASFTVVRNRAEFALAMKWKQFDLILADNGLPGFSGLEALKMSRQDCPGIPFICVSGAATQDQVLYSMSQGATDYVLKDELPRLVAAVRREEERLHLLAET